MANFDTVFFDLDGTLIDSIDLIGRSINYTCARLGKPQQSPQELLRFVGPPLVEGLGRFLELDRVQAEEAVRIYREYYLPHQFEVPAFPGATQALLRLQTAGVKLAVTSAKIQLGVVESVRHLGWSELFSFVGGTRSPEYPDPHGGPMLSTKSEVIGEALRQLGGREQVGRVVVVGDRDNDFAGARAHGLPVIGVSWGAGSEEEFLGAPFVYSWEELLSLLGV